MLTAKDAADPKSRAEYKKEQKLWLALAARIEPDEEIPFEREPKARRPH
jgi:hypothetical protein